MKSEIDKEIIRRVKAKRIKEGVSLRSIASAIGTHHSFPPEVEDEDSSCKYSAVQLFYIAQYLDCPVAEFFPPPDNFPSIIEKPNR